MEHQDLDQTFILTVFVYLHEKQVFLASGKRKSTSEATVHTCSIEYCWGNFFVKLTENFHIGALFLTKLQCFSMILQNLPVKAFSRTPPGDCFWHLDNLKKEETFILFFFQELFSWSSAITTDLLYTSLNLLTTSNALKELTIVQPTLILQTGSAQNAHLQIVQSWVTML